jgi:plastocyanin
MVVEIPNRGDDVMRWKTILAMAAAASLLLAACGGEDQPAIDTSPTEEATSPGTTAGGAADIELEAEDIAFDQTSLSASAGAAVTMEFKNRDDVPHNFALYTEEGGDALFEGEIITGPDAETTYTFDAPAEAGSFHFQCDVHPQQMTGTFEVA